MSDACSETMLLSMAFAALDAERKKLNGRIALLESALREAAQSLETLSTAGGRDSEMIDMSDMLGYANSRAKVAWAALETP